ncbi:two-component response regulator two component transcriptional regulator [Gloeomargarita lithophora Alchichica-D10]|uniref:Two-component response regulator two component transcriptional regulator n=1 Tax=Gloeomargarita lithophora Alchichica-D10 TaxID=1188229 RepID=A0A1J0ADN9_9CYAN|nr:response regulator transcription factor [Gloeomargarita lithophora]APB34062.1 two-component response regulator two component transcriptional regulator [Gloeomargarita lithophora Alchichica-D10]
MTDPSAACVLLVASDATLRQRLIADLNEAGYPCQALADPSEVFPHLTTNAASLLIVEASPAGLTLCRQANQTQPHLPILLLTDGDSLEDRVTCLEAGAWDYLNSPYPRKDLIHWLNLYVQPQTGPAEHLTFADLTLDLSTRVALRQQRSIQLTMKEFDLLKFLMENPGRVLSREEIMEQVWGYQSVHESNVIEVYVRYLRLKLDQPGEKHLIQTVRGVGYVLREP